MYYVLADFFQLILGLQEKYQPRQDSQGRFALNTFNRIMDRYAKKGRDLTGIDPPRMGGLILSPEVGTNYSSLANEWLIINQ